jgi:hypothetical protein
MPNACLFCDTIGGASSNEHVIPQWLLTHLSLPGGDMMFQGIADSETGILSQPPRVHSSFGFVQGRICAECNNGWMSRLETAAKPVLVPLIEQHRSLESLTPLEAACLAKWAVKTAYLHSWTAPLRRRTPLTHLKSLSGDTGAPEDGVAVFGMQSTFTQQSAYVQTDHWPQFAVSTETPSSQSPGAAYKIGLQFRHLYLLVAFWPLHGAAFAGVQGMHHQIFPPRTGAHVLAYDASFSIGDGPIDRLKAFADWLAVVLC